MNGITYLIISLKAFLNHPNFKKELNKKVLSLYLSYGTNHMEETFFKYTKIIKNTVIIIFLLI